MDLREIPSEPWKRHPWEIVRAEFFLDVIASLPKSRPITTVLDVGAGDAFFARQLARRLPHLRTVTCWDTNYAADAPGHRLFDPRITLVRDRPEETFHLLLLLDVLEHVDDDLGLLRELVAKNLDAGGCALVSVPAWQALYSAHDHHLGHRRRYSPENLRVLVSAAGLRIVRAGGLFHSLLVPRLAAVIRERLSAGAGAATPDGPTPPLSFRHDAALYRATTAALRMDTWVSRVAAGRGVLLPGLSAWMTCSKPR